MARNAARYIDAMWIKSARVQLSPFRESSRYRPRDIDVTNAAVSGIA
jgi:hypothetical protein